MASPDEILIIKKLAAISDLGMTQKDMAKELGITPFQVSRLLKTDDYKEIVTKLGDTYLEDAKSKWSQSCAKLLERCVTVIKNRLEEDDLDAVKIVLKSLSIGNEETKVGDTSINLILPTGAQDVALEPEYSHADSSLSLPDRDS